MSHNRSQKSNTQTPDDDPKGNSPHEGVLAVGPTAEFAVAKNAEEENQPCLPSNLARARQAPPPGWVHASPSCLKLWFTLCFAGPHGLATAEDLATVSGLSGRTIYKGMEELSSLGLVKNENKASDGIRWTLQDPPQNFPKAAADFYGEKLKQKEDKLADRRKTIKGARDQLKCSATEPSDQAFQQFKAKAADEYEKKARATQDNTAAPESNDEDNGVKPG
jgi:hypothetical protein